MPATDAATFGRTIRSPDEVAADARAAAEFWAGLDHLDDGRRITILREAVPAAVTPQADAPTNPVDPSAVVLPPPQLGRRKHDRELAREYRARQLWLERATHPSHQLLARLRAERDAIHAEVA
ncbi:MAG: hypothetical protein J0G30_12010 [Actinomycetales bacterium]|nr:hypothetical protein [Actinomycetales bacterium]